MTRLRVLASRIRALFSLRRIDREFEQELESHEQLLTEENLRRGMSPGEARRAARLHLGNPSSLREANHDQRSLPFLESAFRDIAYAVRMLRKSPAFAVAAILAMAVGIGANTANFSLFNAIAWNPIPVSHFGRLTLVYELRTKNGAWTEVSPPDFRAWQRQARSFAGLGAFRSRLFELTGQRPAEEVEAIEVTPNFFHVLGARMLLGRSFSPGEAEQGRGHVAILSYGYWCSRFGGNRSALGRTIELNHAAYTIVGVLPRAIDYPPVNLFVPLALSRAESANRGVHVLSVLGRLAPGVSLAQAQAELATISSRLAQAYPATNKNVSAYVASLRVQINGNITYRYSLIFAVAMGLVLLIACANVMNLQFARGSARQKEIALRCALGASRPRIVRQLLVESVLTAMLGAAAGLLLALVGLHLIAVSTPVDLSRMISGGERIHLSAAALIFTVGVAVFAGIASGLLPAVYGSKPNLGEMLKEGGRSSTPGRSRGRTQAALVVVQIALALVLLVATALMLQGFHNMVAQQEQFSPSSALLFRVDLRANRYEHPAARLAYYREALAKLRASPGARAAALFTTYPCSNDGGVDQGFEIAGQTPAHPHSLPWATTQSVSPGFFSLLHIPLLSGRDFSLQDGPRTLPVAIVNSELARYYWPHQSPVGKQIRLVRYGKAGPWLTVVGVVGNVLWDWTDRTDEMAIFQPYTQKPRDSSFFAIRTGSDPDSLVPVVREEMAAIDPDIPLTGYLTLHPESLSKAIRDSTGGIGVTAGLMTALGFIAFALAAIGVYGVMAFAAAQRRHEIGVRMALGADSRRVLWLMLRRSALLLGIGVAVGLPLAYALARLIGGLMFGVGSTDPSAFVAAIAILGAAALAAGYFPARRAAQIDPVETLRQE